MPFSRQPVVDVLFGAMRSFPQYPGAYLPLYCVSCQVLPSVIVLGAAVSLGSLYTFIRRRSPPRNDAEPNFLRPPA